MSGDQSYVKINKPNSALASGFNNLHVQAKQNSKYDNQVHVLSRDQVKSFPGPPTGAPIGKTQNGGKKYIYCPKTLNKFSINSKKGKNIINNYINHCRVNNKKSNCLYSKIYNEKTGRMVSIYGKIGKNIIKNL